MHSLNDDVIQIAAGVVVRSMPVKASVQALLRPGAGAGAHQRAGFYT
jgi:hypothetical protein